MSDLPTRVWWLEQKLQRLAEANEQLTARLGAALQNIRQGEIQSVWDDSGGGTSGSATAQFKITATLGAATWSGGTRTAFGSVSGHLIDDATGAVDSASTTIKNAYPDPVTVSSGKARIVTARQDADGDWWLETPSCTEVSA